MDLIQEHQERPELDEAVAAESDSEDEADDDETSVGLGVSNIPSKQQRERIATKENKAILVSRLLVIAVLVLSAVAVGVTVFRYLSDQEQAEYEQQFESAAAKVLETVGQTLDHTLGATDALVVKIVSHARASNLTWPFVTLPHFEIHANKVLRLSKGWHVGVSHFVTPQDKLQWEDYATANDGWIKESQDIMERNKDWVYPINRTYTVSRQIYGFQGFGEAPMTDPAPGFMDDYAVQWQTSPSVPQSGNGIPYNFDGWTIPSFATGLLNAVQSRKVAISRYEMLEDPNDEMQVFIEQAGQSWAKTYNPPGTDLSEPKGLMIYPIIDSLESIRVDPSNQDAPVVGSMVFAYFWRDFIKNVLPANSNGIVVVFGQDPDCGMPFTYQLMGPKPVFLGVGDRHDSKYDAMGYTSSFNDLMDLAKEEGDNSYTGLPLTDSFCTKSIAVYPSQLMEDDYKTSSPLIMTIIAIGIFVFTSIVFIGYDLLVARRQRIVMQRAIASGTIVASLFPEKVAQQLYQETQRKKEEAEANQKRQANGGFISEVQQQPSLTQKDHPKAMAELYEDTTVLFADLVGFTKWSSTRAPADVFELLEAIYGAFDAIADKYNVFKIETIGDCYLAVTGIPEPQKDHAVIMARFARRCMVKMNQVVNDLSTNLGEDTANLEMRVGMHSGATTAGVLRGAKGRFQLFGDTVNTAARMESNGVRGRIHVSEATANLLQAADKGFWVAAREDKIVAKGKGQMTTYWVNVVSEKSSYSRVSVGSLMHPSSTAE